MNDDPAAFGAALSAEIDRRGLRPRVLRQLGRGPAAATPAAGAVAATVAIVDDDATMRAEIRELLDSVGLACESYATGRAFLDELDGDTTACVVSEMRLPDMRGVEILEELGRRGHTIPFVAIARDAEIATAVRAMRAGAVDFLEKPFRPQSLLDQIQRGLVRTEARRRQRTTRTEMIARVRRLTQRERDVVGMVARGRTSREIAAVLGLSPRTVHAHRAVARRKLGAQTLADLIRIVLATREPGGGDSGLAAPTGWTRRNPTSSGIPGPAALHAKGASVDEGPPLFLRGSRGAKASRERSWGLPRGAGLHVEPGPCGGADRFRLSVSEAYGEQRPWNS